MESDGNLFVNALKSFIKTSYSYSTTKSDTNLIALHWQLDNLNELSASESEVIDCDPRNLALTETVSSLVTLLIDENVTNATVQRILDLFQKWMSIPTLHDVLKTTFQLGSTIASFVSNHADDEDAETIVSQCLEILKTFTYDVKINNDDVYFEDFLKFLVHNVQMERTTNRTNCVVILANVCRRNAVVQSRIRNMEGVRYFYRNIVNMLSLPSNDLLQVAALSVFTSVAANEEIGCKLFHTKNVIQTLELIFHKIMNRDSDVHCFAIDILIDLLAIEKIRRLLLQYEYLDKCLTKILRSLDKQSSSKSVCKIYELLLTMPSLPAFQDVEPNSESDHPMSVALHWLARFSDKFWNPSVWAAKFITQIWKNSTTPYVHEHFDDILSTIVSCLESLLDVQDASLAAHCETLVSSMDLLLTLSQNKSNISKVVGAINVELCTQTIDFLVGRFKFEFTTGHQLVSNNNANVVDAILHTLLVMKTARNSTNGMQNSLYQYIQDPRMMPIFAHALTSTESRDVVNNALDLIFLGSKLPDFPTMRLGESMTTINRSRGQFADTLRHEVANTSEHSACGIDRSKFAPFSSSANEMRPVVDEQISEIIEKFEKGLEVKDVKPSVIMEMYEHKLRSLEMKERHLQGLLDANASALQHAERILAVYRSRLARSDAETLQLRQLLTEFEKCSEAAKEETTKAMSRCQVLESDLQACCKLTNELEEKNENHKRKATEKLNKIQSLQNAHKEILREKKILSDANIVLQQSRDDLETKAFELGEKLSQANVEKINNLKQLKEREDKIKDLEETGRKLETDKENLTETTRELKDDVKSLETEISVLKVKCGEKEILLDELRKEIHVCKQEVDKHREITKMIHDMSALKEKQKK